MLSEHKKGNADADYIFAPLLYDPPWRACQHRQIIKICSTKTDRYSQAHKKSEKASPFFLRTPTTDVIPVRTVCWHVQFDSKQFYYPVLVAPEAISRIIGMSMNVCVCESIILLSRTKQQCYALAEVEWNSISGQKELPGPPQPGPVARRQANIHIRATSPMPCPKTTFKHYLINAHTHLHTRNRILLHRWLRCGRARTVRARTSCTRAATRRTF